MTKKGFTLIELLAVILILGIIALIAIPTVTKIIDQSKKGAFETTVNNIVGAIEDACELQTLKGEAIVSSYTFANGVVSPSLNIKGNLPASGSATVNESCNVSLSVTNGKFTATKTSTSDNITVVAGDEAEETPSTYTVYANGTAIYFNPVTGSTCASGDAVSTTGTKTGCMKWYTFNDGGSTTSTINLILDHNTTSTVAWNSSGSNVSGPAEVMMKLAYDTSSWTGVPTRTDSYSVDNGPSAYIIDYNLYKARLIKPSEIALITGNSGFVESTLADFDWFYLDSNNQTQTATNIGTSNYNWLFDYTKGCTSYGCNVNDASSYGYWTATSAATYFGDSTTAAWCIKSAGALSSDLINDTVSYGIRPVITIPKSVL